MTMKVFNVIAILFIAQNMMMVSTAHGGIIDQLAKKISSKVRRPRPVHCKPGEMVGSGKIFTSGSPSQCGASKIATREACKSAATYNREKNIDNNKGFREVRRSRYMPHGCFAYDHRKHDDDDDDRRRRRRMLSEPLIKYHFNSYGSKRKCSNNFKCICEPKQCFKCPINTYSTGGKNPTCTKCPDSKPTTNFETGQASVDACKPVLPKKCQAGHEVTGDGIKMEKKCTPCKRNYYNDKENEAEVKCQPCRDNKVTVGRGQSKCVGVFNEQYVLWKLENIDVILAEQKERYDVLNVKNSRLWQKEGIRLLHDELMQQRKSEDDEIEKASCKQERDDGTIIFPAIEISNEIEKIEDTTCIDTNRDELLKSFCSFTSDLDELFRIQGIKKQAKTFWPNICCKERRDTTLEVCKDPNEKIQRENIIPFALSQGGNYSRHNLYVEVSEALKKNGYLHLGMIHLLDSFEESNSAKNAVNAFFEEVTLCGPRIVNNPVAKSESKLCELFIPYHHSMKQFLDIIENLVVTPIPINHSLSFNETVERSIHSRSKVGRVGMANNMQQILQAKLAPKAEEKCKHADAGSEWTSEDLAKNKLLFCTGYKHVDLMSKNIINVAVHYLRKDIGYNDEKMLSLSKQIRYQVTDDNCPAAPLFEAKDISIQEVAMDPLGGTREWVAVVKLNAQESNGYLQSELQYCEVRKYLIGASVNVEAYIVKNNQCCDELQDYKECKKSNCESSIVKTMNQKHYSKNVVVTGTTYQVVDLYGNRRKLLSRGSRGGC